MAKAKKLRSGSWRCLVYDFTDADQKRHYKSFTADSKKEAEYLAAAYALTKKEKKKPANITLKEALEKYCDMKSNVLSPSTLYGYRKIGSSYMSGIIDMKLDDLNQKIIQQWVNDISRNHSPKTVQNAHGLLSAVLDVFAPDTILKTTLPQKIKPQLYVPSDDNIKELIEYVSEIDKDMELAIYLAAFGTLRRSEVCALEAADVDRKKNVIQVRRAVVIDSDRQWIVKTTKTASSNRYIPMPAYVIDKFPTSGRVVNLMPDQVSQRFIKYLKRLDIPHFRFHDLRHYAASVMHAIGIPDQYIMQRGGWSSDKTLKNIYRGTMADYEEEFNNTVLNHFEAMQHEMQHKKRNP